MEMQAEMDRVRIESYGITIERVEVVLRTANATAAGGSVLRGRYRYSLRTIGELRTVDEIKEIIVERRSLVRLEDIAEIRDGYRERESITRFNGQDAVGILIFKEAGTNSVRVAERVEEVIEELRVEYPEVGLEIAMYQADFVGEAISNVVDALIQGGLLAFLVLFVFLREERYRFTTALSTRISAISTSAPLTATASP